MAIVVIVAQGDESVEVGGAAGAPVIDVVDLHVACPDRAAGVAAALVAGEHEAAGAGRDDALGAPDADRGSVGLPDRSQDAVARDPLDHVRG